jgi:hypothetical protein
MSSATGRRSGTANRQYNKRIPRDIQDRVCGRPLVIHFPEADDAPAFTVHVEGMGSGKIQFSLRTPDPAIAKGRRAIADAPSRPFLRRCALGRSRSHTNRSSR